MSDGANLGITAKRALDTILGGDPQPSEAERTTREETRQRVLAAPLPGEGPSPWERAESGEITKDDGYSLCADSLAHAFLVLAETRQLFYPDDGEIESLRGKPMDGCSAFWEAAKERWLNLDEWLGGASGFQVGFAHNTVRFILARPPTENPAIVEVRPAVD